MVGDIYIYIITQLAVYTTYIPLIVLANWLLYATDPTKLWEPEAAIDVEVHGVLLLPVSMFVAIYFFMRQQLNLPV